MRIARDNDGQPVEYHQGKAVIYLDRFGTAYCAECARFITRNPKKQRRFGLHMEIIDNEYVECQECHELRYATIA